MKTLEVHRECTNFDTYRAARVKSLFNAEYGHTFDLRIDTDIDEFDWQIGIIVGPSANGMLGEMADVIKSFPFSFILLTHS